MKAEQPDLNPKIEANPQAVEIRESAVKGRLELLKEILNDSFIKKYVPKEYQKVASDALNFVPFKANIKMSREAWKGETAAGEPLLPLARAIHSLVAVTGFAAYPFMMAGSLDHSSASWQVGREYYILHWSVFLARFGPKLLNDLRDFVDEPEFTRFLESENRILGNYGYDNARRLMEEYPLPTESHE